MSDVADLRARRRVRCAVAVLLLGFVVAFVPGLAAGERFLGLVHIWFGGGPNSGPKPLDEWIEPYGRTYLFNPGKVDWFSGTSAITLVRSETAWAVVAASLAMVPPLFVWWRRAGFRFARVGGIACAVAASAAVVALVASMRGISDLPDGVWWTVPLGGALMAAAFVVAPAPRRRDE